MAGSSAGTLKPNQFIFVPRCSTNDDGLTKIHQETLEMKHVVSTDTGDETYSLNRHWR